MKQQFEDSLKKRNFSAHDANTDTEITYLNSLLNTIVAICLGYDILISESIKLIKQLKTKEINDRKITHKQIKFRFIEKNDEFWREIIKGGKRAITKNKDFQIVFDSAIVRSSKNAEVLIEKNSKGSPVKWFTPFVD